ncbi:helix-turn-helix domain-containing protein [Brevibacillus sp. NPDC058079]|uniref:helix-turn-helix domain-containing protein n=1 Tax=Brevibacillus sp. NPDC058079 TaxID=3346330 RepID=UPI0036E51FAF
MIGTRLRELRGSKSQDEVAEQLGIARASVSHYEVEQHTPNKDMLIRMALYFQTSVDYILGLTDEKEPYLPPKQMIDFYNLFSSLSVNQQRIVSDLMEELSKKQ